MSSRTETHRIPPTTEFSVCLAHTTRYELGLSCGPQFHKHQQSTSISVRRLSYRECIVTRDPLSPSIRKTTSVTPLARSFILPLPWKHVEQPNHSVDDQRHQESQACNRRSSPGEEGENMKLRWMFKDAFRLLSSICASSNLPESASTNTVRF